MRYERIYNNIDAVKWTGKAEDFEEFQREALSLPGVAGVELDVSKASDICVTITCPECGFYLHSNQYIVLINSSFSMWYEGKFIRNFRPLMNR